VQLPLSYKDIIDHLRKLKPKASEILDNCRVAVDKEFVSLDSFKNNDYTIYIVPPSSGG
jgi:molybdopterin synthase sulfur carrier subunit